MLAYIATESGPALTEIETPTPRSGQILVRIHAAALNRADLFMADGGTHGPAGGIGATLGLEWAGEVVGTGERVMGSGGGGYAQYVLADPGRASPIPAGMDYETAATLPVALRTMHDAVVTQAQLKAGQSILIHGASSGVGLMGLQIGKFLGASIVIGTSTNPGRRGRLKEFGCDLALDTTDPKWPEEVKKATGGNGVDLIVDMVSGPTVNGSLEAAKILGRIVNVGRLGGAKGEFNFDLHASKRVDYIGVTNRTRTPAELNEVTRLMRADLWPAVEAGKLSLPIDKTFPLDNVADALAMMRANQHFGKIVLVI
jgi:NADPH2:quinone reductase